MDLDGVLDGQHIGLDEASQLGFEPGFVRSHDLVGHRLAGLPFNRHNCLAWVGSARVACQRHHHHPGKVPVPCIITDNDRRTVFLDFCTYCWIELNPSDVTALHWPCP